MHLKYVLLLSLSVGTIFKTKQVAIKSRLRFYEYCSGVLELNRNAGISVQRLP